MHKFLAKAALFFLPILLCGVWLEYCYRQIPNDYSYKNDHLLRNARDVEILVLGSSHAFRDVDPAHFSGRGFNAAHLSQSLDYDYRIFEKFRDELENLEWIVLPVSYFTFFTKLEDGAEKWRAKNYSIYYGLDLSVPLKYRAEVFNVRPFRVAKDVARYLLSERTFSRVTVSELGFGTSGSDRRRKDLGISGRESSARHTKADLRRLDDNLAIVDRLAEEAAERGVEVFLFTPPAWATYTERLDPHQLGAMRQAVGRLLDRHSNVIYESFMHDPRFLEGDYLDADHLTPAGAKKLTELLDARMRRES